MTRMVRTQIYLPHDLHEELKRRAARDGVPMAVQIRDALRLYLQRLGSDGDMLREDDPIWRIVGAGDGPEDASSEHDKYLYGSGSGSVASAGPSAEPGAGDSDEELE